MGNNAAIDITDIIKDFFGDRGVEIPESDACELQKEIADHLEWLAEMSRKYTA